MRWDWMARHAARTAKRLPGTLCDPTPEPWLLVPAEAGKWAPRHGEDEITAALRRRIIELEIEVQDLHAELDRRGAPQAHALADTTVMPRIRSHPAPGRPEVHDAR